MQRILHGSALQLAFGRWSMARPMTEIEVPLDRTTIILALDVSRSMCVADVDPDRLTVAQDASLAFIDKLTGGTQLVIVAFSDFAEVNPEIAPSGVNLGVIEGQDPSAEEGYQPDIIVLLTGGADRQLLQSPNTGIMSTTWLLTGRNST